MVTKEYKEISLPFRLVQTQMDIDDGVITIEAKGMVDGKTYYFLTCFANLNQESDDMEMRDLLSNGFEKEVRLTLIFKKNQLKDFKLDIENLAEIMGDERFKNMEMLLRGINETPQEDDPEEMLPIIKAKKEEKPQKHSEKFKVSAKNMVPGIIYFLVMFLMISISFVRLYLVDEKPIGIAFFLSLFFMIVFGGITFSSVSSLGNKCYVKNYQKKIKMRKWFVITKSGSPEIIDKVVFGQVDGRIWSVTIWVKKYRFRYHDGMENFDNLKDFLYENVDGTKIEMCDD